MKKKKRILLIVIVGILAILIIGVTAILLTGYKISVKKPYTKTISADSSLSDKESYQRDFEFIYTEIRDSYVNLAYKEQLFQYDWDELYKTYSAKLDSVNSEKDFYALCRAFITELKDGHLIFGFYSRDVAGKVLPYADEAVYALNIRLIENKPIIFYSRLGEDWFGCEILSINDVPFMDILDTMIAYHYEGACDNHGARSRMLINGKFYSYFSYFYDTPPQVLSYKLRDAEGNVRTAEVDMQNVALVKSAMSSINFGFHNADTISYKIINNVGYILIPSFGYPHVERDFDNAVQSLKKAQAVGVVIDVRYNGGGDQSFRKVLGYLTDKELMIANFRYRKSERFNELYALRPLTNYFRNSSNNVLPKETGYSDWWSWIVNPAKEQFLTTIPVVVLTDETIFSSTGVFVNACLENNLATVVGNSVPLSGFGLPTPIVLPSGKYVIYIGFQEIVDDRGQPIENVVKEPHVYAEQELSDFHKNIDAVLEAGINVIL